MKMKTYVFTFVGVFSLLACIGILGGYLMPTPTVSATPTPIILPMSTPMAPTISKDALPTIAPGAEVVKYSATPTFNALIAVSRITLAGNISKFTLGPGLDGQSKILCFKQGLKAYTVTPPSNVHGFFQSIAWRKSNAWNCQMLVYDTTDAIWLSASSGVINQ